jgi:hypothetical protein
VQKDYKKMLILEFRLNYKTRVSGFSYMYMGRNFSKLKSGSENILMRLLDSVQIVTD